ncbi:MAG: hypothetical protein IPI24_00075 [Ignavibacteria bacterium]|nr:hypothetical protein [Ignavibacteria bacterium]
MKWLLFPFIAFFIAGSTQNVSAQWNAQTSGIPDHLWAVHFVDATTGWAVGGWGGVPILKTTNGGVTWINQESGTASWLRGIAFETKTRGWIVGDGGVILYTTNGGSTWTKQSSNTTSNLTEVESLGSGKVLAVGANGTVLRSVDGGLNWIQIQDVPNTLYGDVDFYDARFGCAVGENGVIALTSDGGLTWRQVESPSGLALNAVSFASKTHGWIVGFNGWIMNTTNGGNTWTRQGSSGLNNLACVSFPTPLVGYVSGQDVILKTKDGGSTWSSRKSPTTSLMGSSFPSEKIGWFVGHNGRIYKTETGGEILTAVAATSTPIACRYDTLRLGVRVQEGVAPYTYSWMHGDATPINSSEILSGGGRNDSSVTLRADSVPTYRAVVSDSRGLVDTVIFTTSIRPLPIAQIREQVPGILEGLTDVPTSIANYQWHTIEGSTWQRLPLENKPTFRPITTGSYGVVVTNRSTGCSKASDPYAYIATSIEEVGDAVPEELVVYPNPSSGLAHVALESRNLNALFLVDVRGSTIPLTFSELGPSDIVFNTNHLAPGLYNLIVVKVNGVAHCRLRWRGRG